MKLEEIQKLCNEATPGPRKDLYYSKLLRAASQDLRSKLLKVAEVTVTLDEHFSGACPLDQTQFLEYVEEFNHALDAVKAYKEGDYDIEGKWSFTLL